MFSFHYQKPSLRAREAAHYWDLFAFVIILGLLGALAWAAVQMHSPYHLAEPIKISLSPWALPAYAARTMLRMLLAFLCSVLVTLIVAPLAAKNKQAEKLLIPMIDILQSVPILGVLTISVIFFIHLFPNRLLGPECAAIFAIFTAQVWNMILSLYQSIKTVPKSFYEVSRIFHLSGWQCFWRIEIPYAMPGLLWNSMISASASWFFLVAAEAIAVDNQHIMLPGIGSYIAQAIQQMDLRAMVYATGTMLLVILLYNQLFFRPLIAWSARFNADSIEDAAPPRSWAYQVMLKSHGFKIIRKMINRYMVEPLLHPKTPVWPRPWRWDLARYEPYRAWMIQGWNALLIALLICSCISIWHFISHAVQLAEMQRVFYLGAITALKVTVSVVLSSLLWVPIGVWIGQRPQLTQLAQGIIQFLAAFPANLVYPIAVTGILHFHLNVELWTIPLMILGTQWYILFNVIAGTTRIPKDLQLAAKNLGLRGFLWWKKLALPGIFPYYVTGSMTAAAGCWNACIVSDVLQWGTHKLVATGLGAYIAEHSQTGDFERVALGIAVMCFYVLMINHFLWGKLYALAAVHFVEE